MAKHQEIFEYSKITSQIYIGTNQCCQMHFDAELIKRGIRADISLEAKRLDSPFGVDYYLWLPVKDHLAPTKKQFQIGVEFLNQLIKIGESVYIHCEHGHGRAPTLVATYLALTKNIDLEKAVSLIKNKRPGAH